MAFTFKFFTSKGYNLGYRAGNIIIDGHRGLILIPKE